MVIVSKKVLKGMEAIRISGATNMLDVKTVIRLAEKMADRETANWIKAHQREYVQGVMEGFESHS